MLDQVLLLLMLSLEVLQVGEGGVVGGMHMGGMRPMPGGPVFPVRSACKADIDRGLSKREEWDFYF